MWREVGAIYSIREISEVIEEMGFGDRSLRVMLKCMIKDEILHVEYLRAVLAEIATAMTSWECSGSNNPIVDLTYEAAQRIMQEGVIAREAFAAVLEDLGLPSICLGRNLHHENIPI